MRRNARGFASTICIPLLFNVGCARLVTLPPESVAKANNRDWVEHRPPVKAVEHEVAAPKAPDASTVAPESSAPAPTIGSTEKISETPQAEVLVPPPVAQAPTVPVVLPFLQRASVQSAKQSPPDKYGIPSSLYVVDPLLVSFRLDMERQAEARVSTGLGMIVFGGLGFGVSSWIYATGSSHAPGDGANAGLVLEGLLLGALSLAYVFTGAGLATSGSDTSPIRNYYRETYVDQH